MQRTGLNLLRYRNKRKVASNPTYKFEPKKNTVILRKFDRTKPGEQPQNLAGFSSGQHLALDIYKSDGQREYISLYVQPGKESLEKSALTPLANLGGVPGFDVKPGEFREVNQDLERLNKQSDPTLYYYGYDEIEFDCSGEHSLDIQAIYDWAVNLKKENKDKDYQFKTYSTINTETDNCATLCLKGLMEGLKKITEMPPFENNSIIPVPSPEDVFNYGLSVKIELLRRNLKDNKNSLSPRELIKEKLNLVFLSIGIYIRNFSSPRQEPKTKLNHYENQDKFIQLLQPIHDDLSDLLEDINLSEQESPLTNIVKNADHTINDAICKLNAAKIDPTFNNYASDIEKITKTLIDTNTYFLQNATKFVDTIKKLNDQALQSDSNEIDKTTRKYLDAEEIIKKINITENISSLSIADDVLLQLGLKIKDTIIFLKQKIEEAEEEAKTGDTADKNIIRSYIRFYQKCIVSLRKRYGEINQFLYFDHNFKGIPNDPDDFLYRLQVILPNKNYQAFKNVNTLADTIVKSIESFKPENENFKNKPSLLKPLKWSDRHLSFKEETRSQIHWILKDFTTFDDTKFNLLKKYLKKGLTTEQEALLKRDLQNVNKTYHDKADEISKYLKPGLSRNEILEVKNFVQELSFNEKMEYVHSLINKRKPAKWKFWRSKERAEYEKMGWDAELVCLVDEFAKGRLDVTKFIIALEKLAATAPKDEKYFKKFAKDLKHYSDQLYENHDKKHPGPDGLARRSLQETLGSYAVMLDTLYQENKNPKSLQEIVRKLEPYKQFAPKKIINDSRLPQNDPVEAAPAVQKINQLTEDLYAVERKMVSRHR